MSISTTTRDVGLAIRDFIEGQNIHHFNDDVDSGWKAQVECVDCSDPDNLLVCMSNGRQFHVIICAA